jgi:serine/threonine protein kinase
MIENEPAEPGPPAADGCPSDRSFWRFVQGGLTAEEAGYIEAHIDACESCMAAVAAAARELQQGGSTADEAPRVAEPPALPKSIGRYQIDSVIGQGGMGVVYCAVEAGTGRRVALKTVRPLKVEALAALRQEIASLRRTRHPGVVEILEDGVSDGEPWYAMELLEGETLSDRHRSTWGSDSVDQMTALTGEGSMIAQEWGATERPRPAAGGRLAEALTFYAQLCEPLAFVHRAGIVHCDLKPSNVFIRRGERPVLMDFGLVSRAQGTLGREMVEVAGGFRGTLFYVSPEQIRRQIPDARADLYSLGCMLYETVTGRPPFSGFDRRQVMDMHLNVPPTPPSELAIGVPPRLDALILGLLEKDPDNRIGDAEYVAEVLVSLASLDEGRAPPPGAPSVPYLHRPHMVGRTDTMARLEEHCQRALRGTGSLLLLAGESGIGKTFLSSELARRAARSGFKAVAGECLPLIGATGDVDSVGVSLHPFRALMQRVADLCRALGPEVERRLFPSPLTLALLASYEPSLAALDHRGKVLPPATLPPDAARERLLDALADTVRALAAEAPLLLIIDDLQWADDLSLAFLERLSPAHFANTRLVLLATYRSEEVTPGIERLRERPWVVSTVLGRLDGRAVESMVGDLLAAEPPRSFVDFLAAHSEGNPFFVAEYLRAAATQGTLRRVHGRWALDHEVSGEREAYDRLKLPHSIEALVMSRLAGLSTLSRAAVDAAAVLGRDFEPATLAEVCGRPPSEIHPAIDDMVARLIVAPHGGGRLRFLHDKIREATYSALAPDARRVLHRRAAIAIEASQAGDSRIEARLAEIAYHFRLGGEPARAIDYLERAAARSLRDSANADTVRFLREAEELAADVPKVAPAGRRALWARQTGDALFGLGDVGGSQEHLQRALSLLRQSAPVSALGLGLQITVNVLRQVAHRLFPSWWQGRDRWSDSSLEIARVHEQLHQVHYYRGQYGPLLLSNLRALNIRERMSPTPELATAYCNAAAVSSIVPARKLMDRYFAMAAATLEKSYDPVVASFVHLVRGVCHMGLGIWAEAVPWTERSAELAAALGFKRRWEEAVGLRAGIALAQGALEDAILWGDRLLESSLSRGDLQMRTWGLLSRAQLLLWRGRMADADIFLDEAEGLVKKLGLPERIWLLGLQASVNLERGDPELAADQAAQAAMHVKKAQPVHLHCVDSYARIAEVRLELWRRSRGSAARRLGRDAAASCQALARSATIFAVAEPAHCLQRGTLQWLSGKQEAATLTWRRGLERARQLGMLREEATLLATLNRVAPETPADRARREQLEGGLELRPGSARAFLSQ